MATLAPSAQSLEGPTEAAPAQRTRRQAAGLDHPHGDLSPSNPAGWHGVPACMTLAWLRQAALAAVLVIAPVETAISAEWIVQRLTGTAVTLVDDHWVALEIGQVLSDPFTVRTLGRGNVHLGSANSAIALGIDTAVTLSATDHHFDIELLAGSVSALAQGDHSVTVSAGDSEVAISSGAAEIALGENGTQITAQEGSVSVQDVPTGNVEQLAPGEAGGSDPATAIVPDVPPVDIPDESPQLGPPEIPGQGNGNSLNEPDYPLGGTGAPAELGNSD